MKARVEKYSNSETYVPRRAKKNEELYQKIKDSELENLSIGSNAKVIGENSNHMDIDKIKEILEKNYQTPPKRRSMIEDYKKEEENYELEKTREYDINAILEKAREEKEVDYQEERLKKVRDTQYDILKNLDLENGQNKAANEKTKEELLQLINTINLNEYQKKDGKNASTDIEEDYKELDPLDLFSDLKGDENTIVAGAKEFSENLEEESLKEKAKLVKKEELKENNLKNEVINEEEKMDTTFYESGAGFSKEDFDDFDDIKDDDKMGVIVIKALLVCVVISIIAGLVLFLNDFLKLGWF